MFSVNGIGTTIYGKREEDARDNSYITTKWFIILFFPIFPLGSYRVIKNKPEFLSLARTKYQMTKVALNWDQVRNIYAIFWGPLCILIILAVLFARSSPTR